MRLTFSAICRILLITPTIPFSPKSWPCSFLLHYCRKQNMNKRHREHFQHPEHGGKGMGLCWPLEMGEKRVESYLTGPSSPTRQLLLLETDNSTGSLDTLFSPFSTRGCRAVPLIAKPLGRCHSTSPSLPRYILLSAGLSLPGFYGWAGAAQSYSCCGKDSWGKGAILAPPLSWCLGPVPYSPCPGYALDKNILLNPYWQTILYQKALTMF